MRACLLEVLLSKFCSVPQLRPVLDYVYAISLREAVFAISAFIFGSFRTARVSLEA